MYKKFSIEGERDRQPEKSYLAMGVIFSLFFLLSFSFVSAYNFPSTTNSNYITINYTINGSEVLHNDLSDLQGGTSGEYYHFTESQHTSLVSGITNWITNSVDNLVNYYTKTESDLRYAPISEPLAYNGTLAYNSSLSNYYPNSNPNAFINWSQATNGTLAFNSTFSSFVPYTGATSNVALGNNNFSVNSSTLFVNTNTGRVGIGTTSPQQKLHVHSSDTTSAYIKITNSQTGSGSGDGFDFLQFENVTNFINREDSDMVFRVNDTTEVLRMKNDGKVGIGTDTPLSQLTVQKNEDNSATTINNYVSGIDIRNSNNGANTYSALRFIGYGGNDGTYIKSVVNGNNNHDLVLGNFNNVPNENPLVTIKNNGNVGIGTTNPGQILTVDSNLSQGLPTKSGTAQNGAVRIYSHQDNNVLDIGTMALSPWGAWLQVTDITDHSLNYPLALNPNGGNVGIGTTSPTYKLTVGNGSNTNYSLMSAYFEGNITAAGYITRTSIYDKSGGSALDKIKDASSYLNSKGEINHSALIGYTKWTTDETDYSKPVIENQDKEICEDVLNKETNETDQKCHNETEEVTTYPNTIEVTHEGQNLETQINTLQQAIYELKLDNQNLKERLDKIETETCTIKLFSWCIK